MMYMQVMFCSWKKRTITRTEIVELPDDIKNKGLSPEQITACEEKAKSLCHKGERVSGWRLLEEYEMEIIRRR